MSAEREVELQFLVTPAWGDTLPDVHSLEQYFRKYSHWKARVARSPEGECLVSVRLLPYMFSDQRGVAFSNVLYPVEEKHHIVDGHRIEVDLVVPDVCGSKAAISQDRVEVSVDPEVINRITADQQWQDDFLKRLMTCSPHSASVEYRDNGDIVVRRLSTRDTPVPRQWELFIVFSLGRSLSPFQSSFSTGQLSIRDSCLQRSAVQASSSCDCHTNVMIDLGEVQYATAVKGTILGNLRTRFPALRLTHFDQHLILSGRGDSPKTARMYVLDYVKGLSVAHIPLTDTQAMMLEKKDAKKWFVDVDCVWELKQTSARDKPNPGHCTRSNEKTVVSVIARDSDIQTFKQVILSCFQTSDLLLSKNQVPHLLSDTWSQFLANLKKPGGERASPVVKVQEDKISICDASSTIESTRRAIHDFFHRLEPVPKEACDLRATETITKLQPWQVLFLATARLEKRLPGPLQQALTIDSEMQAVSIHAPFHQLDRRVCDFWNYVVDLSQEVMPLTAASMEVLQRRVGKERVQHLLHQKGIVCNWKTAEGGLVVSAQRSHMQQLQRIFNEAVELDLQSNIRHEDKGLQTGESRDGDADKRQQTGTEHYRNSEKKTDDIKGVDRQGRGEDRPAEKDAQKERKKETTNSKETQTFATHGPNQKQPATEAAPQPEVKQTQNTCLMHTQPQTDENSNNRVQSSSPATVARETTLASLQTRDRDNERAAQTTETQTTWEHEQTAVERDDLSHRDVQGGTGLRSPRTIHQASPGWTGDSPSPTGYRDHPEPQDATESDSLTRLKSIARSQENKATEITAIDVSTGDVGPQRPLTVLTSAGQPIPDPVSVGESGHPQHHPQRSFPERSSTARATNDVTTQTSAERDISEPASNGQEASSTGQGTGQRLVGDSSSRSGFPVPAPALQRAVSVCDRTTQQSEHARKPPTRATSAPGVSERRVESVRNQTVHPSPAARPLEQSQHFGNPSPRNARLAAEGQEPEDTTEMHERDDRPSAEGSTDPPYPQHQGQRRQRGRNQEPFSDGVETLHDESAAGSFSGQARYRGHSASSQQASTTTAAATNNSNNDSVQQQLNSAMHARLSQLECRVSQMERGSVQEWMVHLETRIITMMQEMMQQRQSDSGSDLMSINNPSESQSSLHSFLTESQSSLSSLLSELQQLQQQHQEQSQHSHQRQQQHERQQQQHHHQLQQRQPPQQQHEPQQQQHHQQQRQWQQQQQHPHSLQQRQQQHEQHQRQQQQHHQQVQHQQQKYQLQQQEQQQRQPHQQLQQGQQQQQHQQHEKQQHQQREQQQRLEQDRHQLQQKQPQEMNYLHDVALIIFFAFLLYMWKEHLGPSQQTHTD